MPHVRIRAPLASSAYIKIWDASSSECLQTFNGQSEGVNSVAFSPDSAWLTSASYDRTVKILDVSSCECMQMLKSHSDYVHSVAAMTIQWIYRYAFHTNTRAYSPSQRI